MPPWWRINAARRSPYATLRVSTEIAPEAWSELAAIAEYGPASLRCIVEGLRTHADQARGVAAATKMDSRRHT